MCNGIPKSPFASLAIRAALLAHLFSAKDILNIKFIKLVYTGIFFMRISLRISDLCSKNLANKIEITDTKTVAAATIKLAATVESSFINAEITLLEIEKRLDGQVKKSTNNPGQNGTPCILGS